MKSIFYYIFKRKEYKILLAKHTLLDRMCQNCNHLSSNKYCMISLNKAFTDNYIVEPNKHTCEVWEKSDGRIKPRIGKA